VELLREEDRKRLFAKRAVVWLDVDALSEQALTDPATCFRELGDLLVDGYVKALRAGGRQPPDGADDWVDLAWRRPGTPEQRLKALLLKNVLGSDAERVILVVDRFERIVDKPAGNPVARLLRQWIDDQEETRLLPFRLLFAVTDMFMFFSSPDSVSELVNLSHRIRLENFDLPKLEHLARLHGGGWSEEELRRLHDLVDGQPYLSRQIMYLAANGATKESLFDLEWLKLERDCSGILLQMWLRYGARSDVVQPFCKLIHDPGAKLPPDQSALLRQAGLVRPADGSFVVANQLLASYFKDRS
jgi:hypothetical protein